MKTPWAVILRRCSLATLALAISATIACAVIYAAASAIAWAFS